MPKTDDELLERDANRDIGAELLESLREMKAGEAAATHSTVAIARYRVKMSQTEFAKLLAIFRYQRQYSGRRQQQPSRVPVVLHRQLLRQLDHRQQSAQTGLVTYVCAHGVFYQRPGEGH